MCTHLSCWHLVVCIGGDNNIVTASIQIVQDGGSIVMDSADEDKSEDNDGNEDGGGEENTVDDLLTYDDIIVDDSVNEFADDFLVDGEVSI